MSKKISYHINYVAADGSIGSVSPDWWQGDMEALVARMNKCYSEVWHNGVKHELSKPVRHVRVERVITETVKEYGEKAEGCTISLGGNRLMVFGTNSGMSDVELLEAALKQLKESGE